MLRLLDSIESPADLRGLELPQLQQLAEEIREELVSTVSNNGGHLASSLGVVELTIALHRVFQSPQDKIIWDVGHQAYAHKLLTGRRQLFSTLRCYGGLSGFTDRCESPHDPFGAGHASTSLSAALGMAIARDIKGENHHVVAVIGDGALTGGMAFEALNHAGHMGTRLIVILNDNGMAISPSVGGLSRFLRKMRFDPRYRQAKARAGQRLSLLPGGRLFWRLAWRMKAGFKRVVFPPVLWEELGFAYLGPVNGHDLQELEHALTQAREYRGKPVFLHLVTTKGKGYKPAEQDAVGFHGLAPNGDKDEAPTYSQVFGRTLLRLMEEEPRVIAITAAMTEGTGLAEVARRFPNRVYDVGICEQHAVTYAAGLATQGFIPVVAIYSTFLQRAFDQLIHDVCLQDLPVVFAIDRGGIVGEDGKTHHGLFDLSYLTLIPNIIVAAPRDENELQHLLFTALRAGHPMAVRYPRGAGQVVSLDATLRQLPLGQGEILRQGRDVSLIALGSMVAPSLEAANLLASKGIEAEVVDARYAKPLDSSLISEVASKTGRVVTVEEGVLTGGFGSAVLRVIEDSGKKGIRVRCLGLPDVFVEHGSQEELRSKYGLDAPGIVREVSHFFPELASIPRAVSR